MWYAAQGGEILFLERFFLVKVNYFWKAFEKLVAMLPAWWGPLAAWRATAWCPPQASRAPPLQASCRCPSWIHLNPSQASLSKISRVNLWSRSALTAWLDLSDWVQSRCQHSPIILAPDLFVGFCCFFFYFAKSATFSNVNTFSLSIILPSSHWIMMECYDMKEKFWDKCKLGHK